MKNSRLVIELPPRLKEAFRKQCKKNMADMSVILRHLISGYLKEGEINVSKS